MAEGALAPNRVFTLNLESEPGELSEFLPSFRELERAATCVLSMW